MVAKHLHPALAALGLLVAACAGISSAELQSLGARLDVGEVDFASIHSYAERAHTAYAAEAVIRERYPKTVRIHEPSETEVLYFLERDEQARVQTIAVRGTVSGKNFAEDFDVHLEDDLAAGIPVHAGFDNVAEAMYADLKPYLRKDHAVRVTGHSLGGAIAALLAIYLVKDGYQLEKVVTFGQPRFTTATGVGALGYLPMLRVVDEYDLVPLIPPALFGRGKHGPYEHVGPEVILLEGPHYVYLESHNANRLALGEFWRVTDFANVDDHKMANYLERIGPKTKGATAVPYNQREKYARRVRATN